MVVSWHGVLSLTGASSDPLSLALTFQIERASNFLIVNIEYAEINY
jgi:hypothetical protein